MCEYYSTSCFRNQIRELTKKTRDGYCSVVNDICNELKDKTINEIRISLDRVKDEEKFSIVKLRIKNGELKLSKKDGFRLIYLVRKDKDIVILLDIYPKRGNKKRLNVKNNNYNPYLQNYIDEAVSLVKHDIENDLTEIIQPTP